MTHEAAHREKLLNRVRRLRGQVEAIERALQASQDCDRVLHLISACRGALGGLMLELVEHHIHDHLVPEGAGPPAVDREAADLLVSVLRQSLK